MKKFVFCMVVILALIMVMPATGCPEQLTLTAEEYNQRGMSLANQGKNEDAVKDYTRAIKLDANDPQFYVNRGIAYLNMQEFDLAISDFDKAIELSKDTELTEYVKLMLESITETSPPPEETPPPPDKQVAEYEPDMVPKTWVCENLSFVGTVIQDSKGNYVIVGDTYSGIFIAIADSNGNFICDKVYKTDAGITNVFETPGGGYTLIGTVGGYLAVSYFDASGEFLSTRKYDYGEEGPSDAIQTPDGAYVIAGFTTAIAAPKGSADDTVFGHSFLDSYDVLITKIDSEGNQVIRTHINYKGFSDDFARSIIATADGGYVVAGFTQDMANNEPEFIYLAKVDSSCAPLWQRSFRIPEGKDDQTIFSMVLAKDGGYLMTRPLGGPTIMLIKTTPNGDVVWTKEVVPSEECFLHPASIMPATDGGYIIVCEQFVIKVDDNGDKVWEYKNYYKETKYPESSGVLIADRLVGTSTSDGGYVLAGYNDHLHIYFPEIGEDEDRRLVIVKIDKDGKRVW